MMRAMRPVRSPLHSVGTDFPAEAKKRLIATADPRSIGILPALRHEGSDHRESQELSSALTRNPRSTSFTKAKKRLIATRAKLEFVLTNCNHRLLTISNRNKKHVSATALCSKFVDGRPRFKELGSRIKTFLIGNDLRIEIVPTDRKQRRATNSNR
jgi:hypothetical protein